jgi:flavorubredoxin
VEDQQVMTNGTSNEPLPRELAPGLFWLGSCYPINFQGTVVHNNNAIFLIAGERHSALIETGVAWETQIVLDQVASVLERPGIPPLRFIFETHAEQGHSGALALLLNRYPTARVHGDITDYHLVFPEFAYRATFADPGDRFDLGGREIVVVESVFRDLVTSRWYFDTGSAALFPGDGFAYAHFHDDHACGLLAEEAESVDLPQQMVYFAMSAFHWTQFVDLEPYVDRLERLIFDGLGAKMVLSTHGLPISDPVATMPKVRAGFEAIMAAPPPSVAAMDDVLG